MVHTERAASTLCNLEAGAPSAEAGSEIQADCCEVRQCEFYSDGLQIACVGCSGRVILPDHFCFTLTGQDCCEMLMVLITPGESAGHWHLAAASATEKAGSSLFLTTSALVGQRRTAQLPVAVLAGSKLMLEHMLLAISVVEHHCMTPCTLLCSAGSPCTSVWDPCGSGMVLF